MRRWLTAGRRLAVKTWFRAHRAAARLATLFRTRQRVARFDDVHRRLELFIAAAYGRAIPIVATEANVWTRQRVRQLAKRDPLARQSLPGTDGATIHLPPELPNGVGGLDGMKRYQLIALEQAERIQRASASLAPQGDAIQRDLYLVREGTAIDRHIAHRFPGFAEALAGERQNELTRRPRVESLTQAERKVEELFRAAMTASCDDTEAAVRNDPEASLAWAQRIAPEIKRAGGHYRGLRASALWGVVRPPVSLTDDQPNTTDVAAPPRPAQFSASDLSGPKPTAGTTEQHDSLPNASDDSTSESPQLVLSAGEQAVEPLSSHDLPPALLYDEWNADRRTYVRGAAHVRLYGAVEGDETWGAGTRRRHAILLRRIQHQFERLRARRTLLRRQLNGDELDVAACIEAMVDRHLGHAPDDRLYLDTRPARRGLAIVLLADVSGSTETQVTSEWRIVDIEKIALLLASVALDSLGDPYAMYAFAGRGVLNVKLTALKDFGEPASERVQRRIAGLEPGGFTRMGAAVRHATAQLSRQSAGHRLLILLSDGRPNDVDTYQGDYGVEDSRQAVSEARSAGVFPFCLTIDHTASEYLPRIFGRTSHSIVQRPDQLPAALLRAVRMLVGGA